MKKVKMDIEEQILLYLDGELDAEASDQLLKVIAENKEYETLLENYQSLILEPVKDETADFSGLIKPTSPVLGTKQKKMWPSILRVAASLATVFILGKVYLNSNDEKPVSVIPQVMETVPQVAPSVEPIINSSELDEPVRIKPQSDKIANALAASRITEEEINMNREVIDLLASNDLSLSKINSNEVQLTAIPVENIPLTEAPLVPDALVVELPNLSESGGLLMDVIRIGEAISKFKKSDFVIAVGSKNKKIITF